MVEKDSKMSAAMAAEMGERVAIWLRQAYPDAKAKRIARDFDVAEATAKSWLAGKPPSTGHLAQMCARWRKSFAAWVLAPTGDWTAEWRLQAEIEAAVNAMAVVESKMKEAERAAHQAVVGDAGGGQVGMGPLAHGTVEVSLGPRRTSLAESGGG